MKVAPGCWPLPALAVTEKFRGGVRTFARLGRSYPRVARLSVKLTGSGLHASDSGGPSFCELSETPSNGLALKRTRTYSCKSRQQRPVEIVKPLFKPELHFRPLAIQD
jgi:hypothetical protein